MSFNKVTAGTLLLAAFIGGALACGPDFPWQLLDDRDQTMFEPVALSFPYEAARLVTAPGASLRVVESEDPTKPPGSDSTSESEAVTVEHDEARLDAWRTLAGPDVDPGNDPDARVAKLEAARRAPDGEAALSAGAGLPPAVLDYIAGAIEFRADRFDTAAKYFEAVDRLAPDQRRIRAVAASYMLGRTQQRLGEMAAARTAFQAARRYVEEGAPDPIGLGIASLGEEARTDLVEAGLLKAPWLAPPPTTDDARTTQLIADAVRLYAEQAARGSKMALLSLREVAERLVASERELTLAVADPLVRRLVVTYVIGRQGDFPWDGDFTPEDIERVIDAVAGQPASGSDDDLDRLAALAYLGGRYDLCERLTAQTTRPLGLWVRAKLALRRGDRAAAAREWTKALNAAEQTAITPSVDDQGKTRLRGEVAVMRLSQGAYSQSLRLLFPVAGTYWGDVTYIAERVLTTDELKAFVDNLPPARTATPESIDSIWGPDFVPADRLRLVLARRLMRDGRGGEALAYFPAMGPKTTDDQTNDGDASTKEARNYLATLEAIRPSWPFDWPWQRVSRAEALFSVATLDRQRGMELTGTEGPPDVTALNGSFAYGVGQAKPDGVADSPSKLLGPDEATRFAASAPKPDIRFHYRAIAADRAAAAADLLPQRSQAYAAALCWAARYAIDSGDQAKAEAIYRRYVANGAYQAWAKDFGQTCPDPDFAGARTYWRRRIETWLSHVAGSLRRHILPVAAVMIIAVLGLAMIWRRRHRAE